MSTAPVPSSRLVPNVASGKPDREPDAAPTVVGIIALTETIEVSDAKKPLPITHRLLIRAVSTFGLLPLRLRGALGYFLGFIAGLVPSRERAICIRHLTSFLGNAAPSLLTARIFGNAGRAIFESVDLSSIQKNPEAFVRCENWDRIQTWLTSDRPLLVLTGHCGNWDMLAAYAIARGVPITTIGREARSPLLHSTLRWMRERYGVETVWRADRSGLKRLINCFREKRVVAALIDQDTKVESESVAFFGESARTPSSIVELGRKFDARVVSAFMFRTSPLQFELFSDELPAELSTHETLAEFNRRLEALIRRFPDQWVWFHKRWRGRPDGTVLPTRQYVEWLENRTGVGSSS